MQSSFAFVCSKSAKRKASSLREHLVEKFAKVKHKFWWKHVNRSRVQTYMPFPNPCNEGVLQENLQKKLAGLEKKSRLMSGRSRPGLYPEQQLSEIQEKG